MDAVGQDKPSAGDQAMDFLNKLNNSYAELRATLDNMQALKLRKYPKNLADAYVFASQYKTISIIEPVTKREQQPVADFVTDSVGEGLRRKTKNNSKKLVNSKYDDDDDDDDDKERRPRRQHHNCPLCDKNHPAYKCPMLELCKKAIEDDTKGVRPATTVVAMFQYEDEDEDGYCDSVVL